MGFSWQEMLDNGVAQVDIIGGGTIEVVGSLYFPDRYVRITGAGEIGMTSDYFAVVGMTVALQGNGLLRVGPGGDTSDFDMPPLPVAGGVDGSVRLIE